jgi:hypothetical protein
MTSQTQTFHLTECVDLFSESNKFDREVRECLSSFFLKTTTNFHNADMQFNPLFGALCWSYTLGGIIMLLMRPKWLHSSNFPYVLYGCLLIFIQGMCIHIFPTETVASSRVNRNFGDCLSIHTWNHSFSLFHLGIKRTNFIHFTLQDHCHFRQITLIWPMILPFTPLIDSLHQSCSLCTFGD